MAIYDVNIRGNTVKGIWLWFLIVAILFHKGLWAMSRNSFDS